jgi:hypothetical protein
VAFANAFRSSKAFKRGERENITLLFKFDTRENKVKHHIHEVDKESNILYVAGVIINGACIKETQTHPTEMSP